MVEPVPPPVEQSSATMKRVDGIFEGFGHAGNSSVGDATMQRFENSTFNRPSEGPAHGPSSQDENVRRLENSSFHQRTTVAPSLQDENVLRFENTSFHKRPTGPYPNEAGSARCGQRNLHDSFGPLKGECTHRRTTMDPTVPHNEGSLQGGIRSLHDSFGQIRGESSHRRNTMNTPPPEGSIHARAA
jgi:hypothetical protein